MGTDKDNKLVEIKEIYKLKDFKTSNLNIEQTLNNTIDNGLYYSKIVYLKYLRSLQENRVKYEKENINNIPDNTLKIVANFINIESYIDYIENSNHFIHSNYAENIYLVEYTDILQIINKNFDIKCPMYKCNTEDI